MEDLFTEHHQQSAKFVDVQLPELVFVGNTFEGRTWFLRVRARQVR